MGLVERGKAAARDAQDRVRASAERKGERIAKAVGPTRYDAAASALTAAAGKTHAVARSARDKSLDAAGQTRAGKKVGAGSRRAVSELQGIPLVGMTPKVVAARNGVPQLVRRLKKEQPTPEHYLWLAEALIRTQREMRVIRAARAVANPTRLVVRGITRTATSLGRENRRPASQRLLEVAFRAAALRVRDDSGDAIALHVMARVYLAQGLYEPAQRIAGLAAKSDPADGRPLVTAAHARLRAGDDEGARRFAFEALERGCTIGHEVTAELLRRELRRNESLTVKQRSDAYGAELRKVKKRDRKAYYGVGLGAPAVTWAVAGQEMKRTATLTRRLARVALTTKETPT